MKHTYPLNYRLILLLTVGILFAFSHNARAQQVSAAYTSTPASNTCDAANGSITVNASGGNGSGKYYYSVTGPNSYSEFSYGGASATFRGMIDGSYTVTVDNDNNPPTVDQSQPYGYDYSSWDFTSSNTSVWQSFTAGTTGSLLEIDMGFNTYYYGTYNATGTLNIYSGTGISGTLLESQSVTVVGSSGYEAFVDSFHLNQGVQVTSGQVYTFEFVPGSGFPYYYFLGTYPGNYSRGQFYYVENGYNYSTGWEMQFNTWVATSATLDGNQAVITASVSGTIPCIDISASVSASTPASNNCDATNGSITITASGGDGKGEYYFRLSGPNSFVDSTGGPSGTTIAGLLAGNYSITVEDENAPSSVDQSQTNGSYYDDEDIYYGYSVWQSFKAGKSGILTEIDLGFNTYYYGSYTATGTLNIYAGTGAGGTLLATQSVNVTGSSSYLAFIDSFHLTSGVSVTSGQTYTFQFVPGSGFPYYYFIGLYSSSSYSSGQFDIDEYGSSSNTGYESQFTTYVAGAATPDGYQDVITTTVSGTTPCTDVTASVSASTAASNTCDAANGSITITASGGDNRNEYYYSLAGPNSFTTSGYGPSGTTITGLVAGNYTVTVEDQNGAHGVDQSQTNGSYYDDDDFYIYYETSVWQSFTSGKTGNLNEIDLGFNTYWDGNINASGTLNIYSGTGIGGTLLGTQAVSVVGSGSYTAFMDSFHLNSGIPVTAGQIYTFQFVPGNNYNAYMFIGMYTSGSYTGGQFDYVEYGNSYNTGYESQFNTYVSAPSTPDGYQGVFNTSVSGTTPCTKINITNSSVNASNTCDAANGSLTLNASGGDAQGHYYFALTGTGANSTYSSSAYGSTSVTFSNLVSGTYNVIVQDDNNPPGLDQSQTNGGDYSEYYLNASNTSVWQSFTAGKTGSLTEIALGFNTYYYGAYTATGTLNIYSGTGIGGALLASQQVNVVGSGSYVAFTDSFHLNSGVQVTSGQVYTFEFTPGSGFPYYYFVGMYPGGYSGGQFDYVENGTSYSTGGWELQFNTYITVAPRADGEGDTTTAAVGGNYNCSKVSATATPTNATNSCNATDGKLTINASGGDGNNDYYYILSGPNSYSAFSFGTPPVTFTGLAPGGYTIVAEDDNLTGPGTLDQSQTNDEYPYYGISSSPGYGVWQSFKAEQSGALSEIDMGFYTYYEPFANATGTLNIYAGTGTGGTLLTTQTVNVNGLNESYYTFLAKFTIAQGVGVTTGQEYTFEFLPLSGFPGEFFPQSTYDYGNYYSNGQWDVVEPGYSYNTGYSLVFNTYVLTGTPRPDGYGDTVAATVSGTLPCSAVSATFSITPANTNCGTNNGSIAIDITGGGDGRNDYYFAIQGPDTGSQYGSSGTTFSNLKPGTYSVTAEDAYDEGFPSVDQSQPNSYGAYSSWGQWDYPGYSNIWQSFTAGRTGKLTEIDLGFNTSCCEYYNGYNLQGTLNIYSGSGIGGSLLTSQSVTVEGSGYYDAFMDSFHLSSSVNVTSGQQYTFQFVPSNYTYNDYYLQYYTSSSYSGGQFYYESDYSYYQSGDQLVFKTYVITPAIPDNSQSVFSEVVPFTHTCQKINIESTPVVNSTWNCGSNGSISVIDTGGNYLNNYYVKVIGPAPSNSVASTATGGSGLTAYNLKYGSYTVEVFDENSENGADGWSDTVSDVIVNYNNTCQPIVASASGNDASASCHPDGYIVVTIDSGGDYFQYFYAVAVGPLNSSSGYGGNFNDGGPNEVYIYGLDTGTYTVTVYDYLSQNGADGYSDIVNNVYVSYTPGNACDTISAVAVSTNASSDCSSDGTITVTAAYGDYYDYYYVAVYGANTGFGDSVYGNYGTNTVSLINLPADNYTVNVYDADNPTGTDGWDTTTSVTVSSNGLFQCGNPIEFYGDCGPTNTTCTYTIDGSIYMDIYGGDGTGNYYCTVAGGPTTVVPFYTTSPFTISNLSDGSYEVAVYDASSINDFDQMADSINFTVNPNITIPTPAITPQSGTCYYDYVTYDETSGNDYSGYSYAWGADGYYAQLNGGNSGTNSQSIYLYQPSYDYGYVSLTVTDPTYGCTASVTNPVYSPNSGPSTPNIYNAVGDNIEASPYSYDVCNSASTYFYSDDNAYYYNWSLDGNDQNTGYYGYQVYYNTQYSSNPDEIYLTVTDGNNCTASSIGYFYIESPLSAPNVYINGDGNGANPSLTANTSYTIATDDEYSDYNWYIDGSYPSTSYSFSYTIGSTSPDYAYLTVTDGNGCTASNSGLWYATAPQLSVYAYDDGDNTGCNGSYNGTIAGTVSGLNSYYYNYYDISCGGCGVSDQTGYTYGSTSVSFSFSGAAPGYWDITASDNDGDNSASGGSGYDEYVTINDNSNCSSGSTIYADITSSTQETCPGSDDGSLTVSVYQGGDGTNNFYGYLYDNYGQYYYAGPTYGGTSLTFSGLSASPYYYYVYIYDNNNSGDGYANYVNIYSYYITDANASCSQLQVNASDGADNTGCNGSYNGEITGYISGGNSYYYNYYDVSCGGCGVADQEGYSYGSSDFYFTFSGVQPGNWDITASDNEGDPSASSGSGHDQYVNINNYSNCSNGGQIQAYISSSTPETCPGSSDGSITISVSSGGDGNNNFYGYLYDNEGQYYYAGPTNGGTSLTFSSLPAYPYYYYAFIYDYDNGNSDGYGNYVYIWSNYIGDANSSCYQLNVYAYDAADNTGCNGNYNGEISGYVYGGNSYYYNYYDVSCGGCGQPDQYGYGYGGNFNFTFSNVQPGSWDITASDNEGDPSAGGGSGHDADVSINDYSNCGSGGTIYADICGSTPETCPGSSDGSITICVTQGGDGSNNFDGYLYDDYGQYYYAGPTYGNTSFTFSGLPAAPYYYYVYVYDANNSGDGYANYVDIYSNYITDQNPSCYQLSVGASDAMDNTGCDGNYTGEITGSVSGGNTYYYNYYDVSCGGCGQPDQTGYGYSSNFSFTFSNVQPGTWDITATDNQGDPSASAGSGYDADVTINDYSSCSGYGPIYANITGSTQESCPGSNNGSITVTVSQGGDGTNNFYGELYSPNYGWYYVGPTYGSTSLTFSGLNASYEYYYIYIYDYDNGSIGSDGFGTSIGIYSNYITDQNASCYQLYVSASDAMDNTGCNGNYNGEISGSISGGNTYYYNYYDVNCGGCGQPDQQGYGYGSNFNFTFNNVPPGSWAITASDNEGDPSASGPPYDAVVTINDNSNCGPQPIAATYVTATNETCPGSSNGSITIMAANGDGTDYYKVWLYDNNNNVYESSPSASPIVISGLPAAYYAYAIVYDYDNGSYEGNPESDPYYANLTLDVPISDQNATCGDPISAFYVTSSPTSTPCSSDGQILIYANYGVGDYNGLYNYIAYAYNSTSNTWDTSAESGNGNHYIDIPVTVGLYNEIIVADAANPGDGNAFTFDPGVSITSTSPYCPSPISFTVLSVNNASNTCPGTQDGSITLAVTGGDGYNNFIALADNYYPSTPNPGSNIITITGLQAGAYTPISVYDVNEYYYTNNGYFEPYADGLQDIDDTTINVGSILPGCPIITVGSPNNPTVDGYTGPSSPCDSNGSVTLFAAYGDGSGNYIAYAYLNGSSTPNDSTSVSGNSSGVTFAMNNLAPGYYSFAIYDAASPNGADGLGLVFNYLLQPVIGVCPITAILSDTAPTTCGGSDGIVSVTVTGGGNTGNNNYEVDVYNSSNSLLVGTQYTTSNPNGTVTFPNLASGSYDVSVTDNFGGFDEPFDGAAFSGIDTVAAGPPLTDTITANGLTTFCQGGSVTLDAGGAYSIYSWTPAGSTETIAASATGTYSVTVTNAGGCTASASQTVTVNPNPSPAITGTPVNFTSCSSVLLDAGSGYTSYAWTPSGSTETITASLTGTYSVVVTDGNGCTGSTSQNVTINQNPVPVITGTPANFTGCGSVSLNAGSGYSTYAWTPSGSTETITALSTATYSVVVTDGNGCSGSASQVVTVNPVPSISPTSNSPVTAGGTIDLTADASGGNMPYTYNWTGPSYTSGNVTTDTTTIANATTAMSGTYDVTVTDNNGCTVSGTANVTVNSAGGSFTWTGNGGTGFGDPGNWLGGQAPSGCAANITIPSTANEPVISSNVQVGNVTVMGGVDITNNATLSVCGTWTGGSANDAVSGTGIVVLDGSSAQKITGETQFDELVINNAAGISLSAGAKVSIMTALDLENGNFNVSAGTLTFLSTSTTQCAIIDNFSSTYGHYQGTLTGSINAQRYYNSSSTFNQHFMGSPLNAPLLSQYGAGTSSGFVIPAGNCSETIIANNSPNGNVFALVESHGASCGMAQWYVEPGNVPATNGQGYSVRRNGAGTLQINGTANLNDDYQLTGLTNSNWTNVTSAGHTLGSGWQLISNPYLATLQISSVDPNIENQVQIWNTDGPYAGSYQPDLIGVDAVIPPFQAFMVKEEAAVGTFTFNATDRTRNPQNFFAQNDNQLDIISENISTGLLDKTRVAFNTNATDEFDKQFDADKFAGDLNRQSIYTVNNNKWMSINVLNSVSTTATVPVGFEPGSTDNAANYSFSFNGVNTFDPTTYIYLQDLQTGTMNDVRNGAYSFTANSTDNWSRFVLHFTPPAVISLANASCNSMGSISVTQPGTANWNYQLKDNNNALISTGVLNQSNPLSLSAQAGTYILTLVDNNGYTVTKSIAVAGTQDVTASFTMPSNTIATQTEVSFNSTSQNADNFSWNFGDGSVVTGVANPVHTYVAPGTYAVTLTVMNATGCSASVTQQLKVNGATGLDNLTGSDISMWSNDNRIYVDFTQAGKVNAEIRIFNLLGQEITTDRFTSNTVYERVIDQIDAAYIIVSVKNDDKIVTRKLFIINTQ